MNSNPAHLVIFQDCKSIETNENHGSPIFLTADFSAENLQHREQGNGKFTVMKENPEKLKILYLAILFLKTEGKRIFPTARAKRLYLPKSTKYEMLQTERTRC
jgi:hypothetical protein